MAVIGWILYGIAVLVAVVYVVSIPHSLWGAWDSEEHDVQQVQILGASVGIIQLLLLAPAIYVSSTGILPRGHLLWMLPLWAISHQLTLIAHQVVALRGIAALGRASIFLAIAGGLTIGQVLLVDEGSLWVSFRLGPVPIPLVGITFIVSLVAAHAVVVALVYLPLRAIFCVD
jgi:hypothetical protein